MHVDCGECERQQPDQNKWTAKTSYFKVRSNFEIFESTRYFLQNKTKKVTKLKNWNFEHFFEISRSVSLVLNRDYGRRHLPAETRPGTPPDLMREKHVLYHEIRLIRTIRWFPSLWRHRYILLMESKPICDKINATWAEFLVSKRIGVLNNRKNTALLVTKDKQPNKKRIN